jgi:hypothetical protein
MLAVIINKIIDNKTIRWKVMGTHKFYLSDMLFPYVYEVKFSMKEIFETVRKQNQSVHCTFA